MEATAVQREKGRVGTGPESLSEVAEKYKAMLAANSALDRFEEDAEQRVIVGSIIEPGRGFNFRASFFSMANSRSAFPPLLSPFQSREGLLRTPKAGPSQGYQLHDREYRILILGRRWVVG